MMLFQGSNATAMFAMQWKQISLPIRESARPNPSVMVIVTEREQVGDSLPSLVEEKYFRLEV